MRRALIPSPRSSQLNCAGGREQHLQHHFLEACFLCQKKLNQNSDIFMYRGNTPFCSNECRQEQMEIDESRDKKSWKLSPSSMKGPHRSIDSNKSRSSKAMQSGTVAVLS